MTKQRATLALILLAASSVAGCSKPGPEPQTITSIEGESFTLLNESYTYDTRTGAGLELDIYAPDGDATAVEDLAFRAYGGPAAERRHMKRVFIKHFNDRDALRKPAGISFSAGPGPLSMPAVYEKGGDGIWSRDGSHPDAPEHLGDVKLDSGIAYALTFKMEEFPAGTLVYDCTSCSGATALHDAIRGMQGLIKSGVIPEATADGLNKVRVIVHAGARASTWQFPPTFNFPVEKRSGGQWAFPADPPDKLEHEIRAKLG